MWKLFILFSVFVANVVMNDVKAQGVAFYKGKFEKAEVEAREGKLPTLLYFRLKDAEPCTLLENGVLANDTLGALYNKRFMNIQVEADKKNTALIQKYRVTEVPLVIWLNETGKEAYRIVGDIPKEVFEHIGRVMLHESPSLEDLFGAVTASDYSLESMQTALLEALSFLPVLQGETLDSWTGEVKALLQRYVSDKDMGDMVNAKDFKILTSYLDEAKLFDPIFEFVLENYDRFSEIISEEEVAGFLVDRNMELIGRLTYSGNEAYMEAVERVGGDLARAYATVKSFVGMDTVMRYQADADYWLHGKKDQDAYVDVKNEYFKVLGDKLRWQDLYNAVIDLGKATGKKFTEKTFKVCMAWIDVIGAQQDLDAGMKLWVPMTKGDCFLAAGDRENAKACYNQAYIISMQSKNAELQAFLKQKVASLNGGN